MTDREAIHDLIAYRKHVGPFVKPAIDHAIEVLKQKVKEEKGEPHDYVN